ncbi:hypothetical protein [Pseudozobellia sp. WGM2]|uniref:hypothetical protein n=1 Tax=Pseudozobellia sp. WGM2 TaxID=2787625 RepID=UPI001ADFC9FF|nr:hypothetical protein [Pseudozobellia sp. WGM2]
MGYIIKGTVNASLFPDIRENVSDALVLIYLDDDLAENRHSSKKEARQLTKKEIIDKQDLCIGQAKTNGNGNFEIKLFEAYDNQRITIDIKLSQAPYQKSINRKKEIQYTLIKLNPVWRPDGQNFSYSYNHTFPFKNWCQIRALFDAWTICGSLKITGATNTKLFGFKIVVMDVDWIKDDLIGTAITDEKGYFRVDYTSADFKKTFLSPILNIETPISTIPGPGIYFKVLSPEGKIIYQEDSVQGHTDERKNIPRCYFVKLNVTLVDDKVV